MYCHFMLRHPSAEIEISKDGELPKCHKCGMRTTNVSTHIDTYTCKQGQSRRNNEKKTR